MSNEPAPPSRSQPLSRGGAPEGGKPARIVSVGTKLAGATIALMLAVTAVIYGRFIAYERESLLHAKETAAIAVTHLFADSCAAPIVFGDNGALNDALATLGRNDDIDYAAVWGLDAQGRVGDRLAEFVRGRPIDMTSVSTALTVQRQDDRIVVLTPVRDIDAKLVGAAALTLSLARENDAVASVQRRTLLVSGAVAAGITALLLAIARLAIVLPLRKLVLAANKIEKGGSSDIDVRSSDEIGQLASAFRSMAKAIQSREERISARNRDMQLVLDNVDQGFLTLDADARISEERSRVVDEWFGELARAMSFGAFLSRLESDLGDWFDLGWTAIKEDILPLDICLQQLPRLIHHNDRAYEIVYRPILDGVRLDKVVTVITDVTARIEREHTEAAQRETMAIFQHILSDRLAFEEFLEEATWLVEAIERFDGSDPAELKRHIHTLKGNAAIYGIESVVTFCHDLESELEDSSAEVTPARKQALSALWANVVEVRSQFSRDGGIVIERDDYRGFLDDLRARVAHDALSATFASWQLEPATKRFALLGEQIKHVARRLGKTNVDVRLEPTKLRLPSRKWAPFWTAFTHVLRNAVDHGIESVEERRTLGKPDRATIALSLLREGREVVISIHDDGRGIDWARIAERARALGLPHATPAELEAALFAQGVSSRTEITTTSGRGVGLSAVREVVSELGGRISLESELGVGTVFRFYLPAAMLVDDAASSTRLSAAPITAEERARVVAPIRN